MRDIARVNDHSTAESKTRKLSPCRIGNSRETLQPAGTMSASASALQLAAGLNETNAMNFVDLSSLVDDASMLNLSDEPTPHPLSSPVATPKGGAEVRQSDHKPEASAARGAQPLTVPPPARSPEARDATLRRLEATAWGSGASGRRGG
eukprot:1190638-Prorocentrum_minimum.AAC.2